MTSNRHRFTIFTYLRYLLQLVLAPGNGWEDIALSGQQGRTVLVRGLIPLALVYAITAAVPTLYHTGMEPMAVVQTAVLEFAVIFAGYYIGLLALTMAAPTLCIPPADDLQAEDSDNRLRLVCSYTLGLVTLTGILVNCLPGRFAVLGYIPVYIAIIVWRAEEFAGIRSGSSFMFALLCIAVLICPWAVVQLFF